MLTVLHFADAHIDIVSSGRHDAQTGLPMRVLDFLKSLDTIVDTAISEKVDLVIFAGDAYKDRNPAPTYQREWGRRIMRLSRAGIPTLLLVGNHDLAPALGRAHALESFETLEVPHVRVLDKPTFLKPPDLEGLPVQVLAIPWISRSGLMAYLNMSASDPSKVYEEMESRLTEWLHERLEEIDPSLPVILTAHGSVQGALYGGERSVMLGSDLVLPGSLVKDPRLDYVALGHIHRPQNLNEGRHPPVVYPGSIERVDAGEVEDERFFVIAYIDRGHTEVEWRKLATRAFINCTVRLKNSENITEQIRKELPALEKIRGAIIRLVLEYPREWETLIDETALREYAADSFEFHLAKHAQIHSRVRLPEGRAAGSLHPLELLNLYWRANHPDKDDKVEVEKLERLAAQIIEETDQ